MKGKTAQAVRIFRVIYSLSIILCAICLMCACVSIYHSGDSPYSRAAVAAAFSRISAVVYSCLGLTLVNFVLTLALPQAQAQAQPRRSQDLQATLDRMHASRDLSADDGISQQIIAQRRARKMYRIGCFAVLTVLSVVFLTYALDGSHFHDSDINGSMIKAMYRLVPCLILSFAVTYATATHRTKSILAEIELLKQLPKSSTPVAPKSGETEKKIALLRLGFVAAAIGLIIFGAATDGIADVLAKAINICTECIGLG